MQIGADVLDVPPLDIVCFLEITSSLGRLKGSPRYLDRVLKQNMVGLQMWSLNHAGYKPTP
jgi:hypothetical protein